MGSSKCRWPSTTKSWNFQVEILVGMGSSLSSTWPPAKIWSERRGLCRYASTKQVWLKIRSADDMASVEN